MKNIHTDKSYSILIVDDHPLVGDGISSMLKMSRHYHIIGYCRSGEEAFEILKSASGLAPLNRNDHTKILQACEILEKLLLEKTE